MNSEPLSKVAPPKSSDRRFSPEAVVWHLGLDQIASGSGEIANRMFAPAKEAGSSTFIFDERNVLYSKLRPYLNKVVCPDSIGVATTELVPLRPDPTKLDRHYLCYYLRSPAFLSWISSKVAGAKMPRAKMDAFWQHQIPLPPLDEQKRIAYLLSKVEGLIAQRKQHLQQLDDLLKSVFLDMFGDPVRNEKGWDIASFENVIENSRNGLSPSKNGTESGYVYTLSAVTGDRFKPICKEAKFGRILDKYFPTENDFLVCRGNGNIELVGKGYFTTDASERVMFPDTIIAVTIKPNSVNHRFLESIWTTAFMRSQIEQCARTTNGTYKINQSAIHSLRLPLPPIKLQERFEAIAASIRDIFVKVECSIADLENSFRGLSQRAFNGELDLSRVIMPDVEQDNQHETETTEPTNHSVTDQPFELPAPADVKKLKSAQGRKTVLKHWLTAYTKHLGKTPIAAESFLELVQQKLSELETTEDLDWSSFEVGAAEYDQIKDWIFQSLESKQLTQHYDDKNNQVRVSAGKD